MTSEIDAIAIMNDTAAAPKDGACAHREGFTLEDNPYFGCRSDDRLATDWASEWELRHRFAMDNGLHAEIGRVACLQHMRDSRVSWQ
ncbi:MAG: hypothetical protein AAGD43_29265 [Pseudomonadota bacterium]